MNDVIPIPHTTFTGRNTSNLAVNNILQVRFETTSIGKSLESSRNLKQLTEFSIMKLRGGKRKEKNRASLFFNFGLSLF